MREFKINPRNTLGSAMQQEFERVLVLGVKKDGSFFAAGSGSTEKHLKDIDTFKERLEDDEWDMDEEEVHA